MKSQEKEMKILLNPQLLLVFTVTILHRVTALAQCELSVKDHDKLYNYSLASPLSKFPHGILSEDGFYKVAANGTVLLFQLCSTMIFNHDPPMCVGCKDCGGPSHCGMGCSALVSNKIDGYPVCTTLGLPSSMLIDVLDKKSPHTGIIIKMSNNGPQHNCSLSVTVICNSNGVQGPQTFDTVGFCDYTTQLKHPSGCAKIISSHGQGLGWFGIFMVIILCLFGVYLLAGTLYRYFVLHIYGIDAIPNLDFWASLPRRIQSLFTSLVRRLRGPSYGYRSSYSPVNF
ncbi:uncharacterized protein LOC111372856 isoform X2 [Olea europaea var. sylvestris]|uniref:uncharacterized protein LOC111372856 isoform X2 n=1 Tax=Olea europaea var. sylvestris TaxID=158386 RepID=UPI000C1D58A5|nr:uncharacterized protein LOC111372856 isoform X2 [Olea europaea var. sylvestris]